MKKFLGLVFALVLGVSMSACGATTMGNKEFGGTLVGAGLGGLLGSQIGHGSGQLAATAVGTLFGAIIGREVGRSLDRADEMYARQALYNTLEKYPSGQMGTWQNPDSGHYGSFTPTRTYRVSADEYCREYQTTVVVGGSVENAYGTACRQPDGAWKIVNDDRQSSLGGYQPSAAYDAYQPVMSSGAAYPVTGYQAPQMKCREQTVEKTVWGSRRRSTNLLDAFFNQPAPITQRTKQVICVKTYGS